MLALVNRQMSTYDPDSELSRFNKIPVPTGSRFLPNCNRWSPKVCGSANSAAARSISPSAPGQSLWGFGPEPRRDEVPPRPPSPRLTASGSATAPARRPPALKKDRADLYVDLSAMAKGYGVDRMAALIDTTGVGNYLARSVAAKSALRGPGNGRGEPWTIAIENRRRAALGRTIDPTRRSYRSTSELPQLLRAERSALLACHQPRTGWPVPHTLASVTVIGDHPWWPTPPATALLAAGPELVSNHQRTPSGRVFVLIEPDGGLRNGSPGIRTVSATPTTLIPTLPDRAMTAPAPDLLHQLRKTHANGPEALRGIDLRSRWRVSPCSPGTAPANPPPSASSARW